MSLHFLYKNKTRLVIVISVLVISVVEQQGQQFFKLSHIYTVSLAITIFQTFPSGNCTPAPNASVCSATAN